MSIRKHKLCLKMCNLLLNYTLNPLIPLIILPKLLSPKHPLSNSNLTPKKPHRNPSRNTCFTLFIKQQKMLKMSLEIYRNRLYAHIELIRVRISRLIRVRIYAYRHTLNLIRVPISKNNTCAYIRL